MKNVYLSLLSFVSLGFADIAVADETAAANTQPASTQFNSQQVTDIKKIMTEYLTQNPDIVMAAFQAGMAKKQEEELVKMQQAVAANKDKIFKDMTAPVGGNPKGHESLVVFMDPNCGYCKKFHGELDKLLNTNKDVKVTFFDIPIMGQGSVVAVKAMLAAKAQGKHQQLQQAIFTSDKPLSKRQIMKMAKSLGIDTKQLEADMKSKGIQVQIDRNLELAKALGINGTPTLIIGENKVVPGYVTEEELNKMLKEKAPGTGVQPTPDQEVPPQ